MKILNLGDLHLWHRNIESRTDNFKETCLDKLSQIIDISHDHGVDFVVQDGDFFNHAVYDNDFKASINEAITDSDIPWYVLAGNHDLLYKNPNSVRNSDLGPMVAGDAVVVYARGKNLVRNDHWLYGIEAYDFLPEVPEKDITIIVAHHFINITESTFKYRFDKDLSLSTVDLRESFPNARWIFSGHDHNSYPVEEHNGFKIVRPGSVMRISSAKENISRQVYAALIDFNTENVEYIPLKFADYRKVFKIEKKEINKGIVSEVDSFVEDIESIWVKSSDDVTEYVEKLLEPIEKETKDEIRSRLREKGVLT